MNSKKFLLMITGIILGLMIELTACTKQEIDVPPSSDAGTSHPDDGGHDWPGGIHHPALDSLK